MSIDRVDERPLCNYWGLHRRTPPALSGAGRREVLAVMAVLHDPEAVHADYQYYVEDNVFEVTGERRSRQLTVNQLPSIQQKLDDVMQVVSTDVEAFDKLLADGGQICPADLARDFERHIGTIYPARNPMALPDFRLEGVANEPRA